MTRLVKQSTLILGVLCALMFAAAAPPHASADAVQASEKPSTAVPLDFPTLRGALAVADGYWTSRGVPLPVLGGVYELPDEDPFAEAGGYAELPGNRIWLARWVLAGPKGSSPLVIRQRVAMCFIVLHERGHNAGLRHADAGVFPIMGIPDEVGMGWIRKEVAPRCYAWARHPFD